MLCPCMTISRLVELNIDTDTSCATLPDRDAAGTFLMFKRLNFTSDELRATPSCHRRLDLSRTRKCVLPVRASTVILYVSHIQQNMLDGCIGLAVNKVS